MAKQTINIGTAANDGTGSSLRAAFDICNDNFTEIYNAATPSGANVTLQGDVTVVGHVNLADNKNLGLGNSGDYAQFHDGTNTYLSNGTGDFYIRNQADDKDIIFQADDGSGGNTEYFKLDGSQTILDVAVRTLFRDSVKATFGAGYDLEISHNGTNTDINNFTGHLNIVNAADDSDIIFQADDGSGGNAEYFRLDGSNTNMVASKTIVYSDSVKASFGNSEDLRIYHSGTNSNIENFTGDLQIIQNLDDGDIIFKTDSGSGGTAEYMKMDGSQVSIRMLRITKWNDNIKAAFGDGEDLQIYHDGSNSYIQSSGTGDVIIEQRNDDKDMVFNCDDGSGGIAEYMRIDGSTRSIVVSASIGMYFNDGVAARFGTGGDLILYHDGTDSYIQNTLSGDLIIENSVNDKDIIFKSDDGSGGSTEYFKLDGSETLINVSASNGMQFNDNVRIKVGSGSGGDLRIYHNGSNSYIEDSGTGELRMLASTLSVRNSGDTELMITAIEDGAVNLYHDNSKKFETTSTGVTVTGNVSLADSGRARFGAGGDFAIYHNGTDTFSDNSTGDLKIRNFADDKDIIFQSDDGSGGVTSYIELDGSDVSTKILTQKVIMSNLPTSDPSNAGQLYNDSGVLKISAG
tara:strand:+ start:645 stop:2534 length:1890 start_codon:yes stop_codon:yes gene_type:complete